MRPVCQTDGEPPLMSRAIHSQPHRSALESVPNRLTPTLRVVQSFPLRTTAWRSRMSPVSASAPAESDGAVGGRSNAGVESTVLELERTGVVPFQVIFR